VISSSFGRAVAVLTATAAALLASGGVALADIPPATGTGAADVNLLNNLNICPDVAAGIGVGNLLGLLGGGTANPVTNGGDVVCVIDDRDGLVPDDAPAPSPNA
jgi:hypothetical protein